MQLGCEHWRLIGAKCGRREKAQQALLKAGQAPSALSPAQRAKLEQGVRCDTTPCMVRWLQCIQGWTSERRRTVVCLHSSSVSGLHRRRQLPLDVIQDALWAAQAVAQLMTPQLGGMLQLRSLHDEPCLILLLRLELLWERLPPERRAPLFVLQLFLQHGGQVLGPMVHEALSTPIDVFEQRGEPSTARQLRDALSILRAVLRASDRASALGLLPAAQQLACHFAGAALFCSGALAAEASGSAGTTAGSSGQPLLWLLWELACSPEEAARSRLSSPAALSKACNVVCWCFNARQPGVAEHMVARLADSGMLVNALATMSQPQQPGSPFSMVSSRMLLPPSCIS